MRYLLLSLIHISMCIRDSSRTLLQNQDFKSIFTQEQRAGTYFSSRDDIVLNHIMRDLAEQNKYIQSIVAIHKTGNIYFYSKLTMQNGKMLKYHRDTDILSMDWVAQSDAQLGKELFYGYNVLFDDNDETFSMVKTLKNTEDGADMGYVVFNIKKSIFLSAFGKADEGYVTNRYLITVSYTHLDVYKRQEESGFSEPAAFVMGILHQEEWRARFITAE